MHCLNGLTGLGEPDTATLLGVSRASNSRIATGEPPKALGGRFRPSSILYPLLTLRDDNELWLDFRVLSHSAWDTGILSFGEQAMAMSSTERSRKKRALAKAREEAAAAIAAQQEETKHGALLAEITLLRQQIFALSERLATRDDLRRFAAGFKGSPPQGSQDVEPFHQEAEPELVGNFLVDPLFVAEPEEARRCAEELIGIARLGDQVQVAFPLVDPSRIGLITEDPASSVMHLQPFLVSQTGVWFLSVKAVGPVTQAVYVLTETPLEALALRAVTELGKGILPPIEAFDIGEIVYVATGSRPDQIAGVIARAKQLNAYVALAYACDPAGRTTAARAAEEAARQKVSLEPVTDVLAMAGPQVTDFVQFWQLIRQQGADVVVERILAGTEA